MRRAVLHPFSSIDDDRLAGLHIDYSVFMRDSQYALEHDSEFIELRRLSRLDPSARAAHVGDAQAGFAGVHSADEFID